MISQVAVYPPSTEVAVIVVVPLTIPVTRPFALTVATDVLELDQVTLWSVASEGDTATLSCLAPSMATWADPVIDKPVTCCFTVNWQDPITPDPSLAKALMVVVPALIPRTTPLEVTDAMSGSELDQVTEVLEALDGVTVADKVTCSPV